MRDFGRIISLRGDSAQVSIQPHGGCEKCAMKNACVPGESTQLLWALNPKEGKVGDEVVVELKPKVKVLGSTLVFIFPLTGLFLGYFLGWRLGGSDDYGVLGAALGIAVFFLLVRLIDKFVGGKKSLKPVIIHILS